MNSNLQFQDQFQQQVDAHQISLDLAGLDDFLETAPIGTGLAEATESPGNEKALFLQLLDKVTSVNQSVEAARERLMAANERMSALATVVQVQTGKLEMLGHYQNQAARVTALERQIAQLEEENARLRRSWWSRLWSWFRK